MSHDQKRPKGLIATKILRRAILDLSAPGQASTISSRIILRLHSFHCQDPKGTVFKLLRCWRSLSFFVSFHPLIGFPSNFQSGGEESALLVLFIMEIDLTLICIYLHCHQADLESEGGCNLLRSWQICSKNRTLELSNQL